MPGLPVHHQLPEFIVKLMSIESVIPPKVELLVLTALSKTFSKSERILKMEKSS